MRTMEKCKLYLNIAVLFMSIPSSNVGSSGEEPDNRRVMGSRGTRIVFSCTWNEKRKNDSEEVRSAYGSKGRIGVCFAAGGGVFSS